MRWLEPLYTGEEARKHLKEYRRLLESISQAEYKELKFYVAVSPANDKNLMELIPAVHLKQAYYRLDSLTVLGLAANKTEAFDLCARMIGDCYICHGRINRELICGWPEKE